MCCWQVRSSNRGASQGAHREVARPHLPYEKLADVPTARDNTETPRGSTRGQMCLPSQGVADKSGRDMSDQIRIRADFNERAVISFDEVDWTPSPAEGVERKMLDRIGNEVARATSIVRYAAGSSFSEHEHGGGEEILVLEGVFSDESGDYPAGTYIRNPPGSAHAPRSGPGCIILVKLRQFQPDDQAQFTRSLDSVNWLTTRPGTRIASLHEFGGTRVRLVELDEGTTFSDRPDGGLECLVYRGGVSLGEQRLGRWGWIRVPAGKPFSAVATEETLLWIKSGHLSAHH